MMQPLDYKEIKEERDFWEENIKDEAIRAGIDPSGTIGCATLHLIGEKVVELRAELDKAWRGAIDQGAEATRLRQLIMHQTNILRDEASRSEVLA